MNDSSFCHIGNTNPELVVSPDIGAVLSQRAALVVYYQSVF